MRSVPRVRLLLALTFAATLVASCGADDILSPDDGSTGLFGGGGRLITEPVVDAKVNISAGDYTSWAIDAPRNATLSVSLTSDRDVSSWLIPDVEFQAYQQRANFDYIVGTKLVEGFKANYTTRKLDAGRYHLVLSNRHAWILSRTITATLEYRG